MATRRQDGYALLVVLLVLSLFVISLAKLVPGWKTEIQREREARSIDHAREYRTAIKRYFHKYGRYPPSIDVLAQKDGQGLRYLRQKWPDPLHAAAASPGGSGTDQSAEQSDWQILHYGEAVTAEIVDQPPQAALAGGTAGSGIAGPGLSGGSNAGIGTGAGAGSGAGIGGMPSTPGSPSNGGATGIGGVAGGGTSGITSGPGSAATSGPGAGIGGGPVIGVASLSKKPAIHSFNGFDTPNDWQFVYNYAQDPSLAVGGASGATGGTSNGLTPPATPVGGGSTGPGHS